jgi:hypothetical protein
MLFCARLSWGCHLLEISLDRFPVDNTEESCRMVDVGHDVMINDNGQEMG